MLKIHLLITDATKTQIFLHKKDQAGYELTLPSMSIGYEQAPSQAAEQFAVHLLGHTPQGLKLIDMRTEQDDAPGIYFLASEHSPFSHEPLLTKLSFEEAIDRAPHLRNDLVYAERILLIERDSGELPKIDEVIKRGIECFLQNHVEQGEFIGWDHHLGANRVGIIGTAVGILTICESENRAGIGTIERSARFLASKANSDGGWGTKSMETNGSPSIVESTCFVLDALNCVGYEKSSPVMLNALAWLAEQQRQDGGWGLNKDSPRSRTLPTTMAINTLISLQYMQDRTKRGVNWLKEAQLPDGSWGAFHLDEQTRSPAHTARAMAALRSAGEPAISETIKNGASWLIRNCQKGRTWADTSEIEYLQTPQGVGDRLEFKHAATPLVVQALLRCNYPYYHPELLGAIASIVRTQTNSGYWHHSLVAGGIPGWAIFENVTALNLMRRGMIAYASQIVDKQRLDEQLDQMVSLVGRKSVAREPNPFHSNNRIHWTMFLWNSILTILVIVMILLQTGILVNLLSSSLFRQIQAISSIIFSGVAAGIIPVIWDIYKNRKGNTTK